MDQWFIQEKNQSILPSKKERNTDWSDLSSNKRKFAGQDLDESSVHAVGAEDYTQSGFGSDTSGTEVSAQEAARGYSRVKMDGTDELDSGALVQPFYIDISTDEYNGFVERNNILDRM